MNSEWEYEELARHLCGLDAETDDATFEEALYERFDLDFDTFANVASALVPLCNVWKSPLTVATYRGFAADGLALVKMKVESEDD